jgi:hypothetical protein
MTATTVAAMRHSIFTKHKKMKNVSSFISFTFSTSREESRLLSTTKGSTTLNTRTRTCASSTQQQQQQQNTVTIIRPDDWHLHVRNGEDVLSHVVPHSAATFQRAIIMPNLVPPVTNTEMALSYRSKILDAVPGEYKGRFNPLMTLYLTDNTSPEDIYRAKESGVVALKMYPAGATTNSDSGVTDWRKCVETLKAMEEVCVLNTSSISIATCECHKHCINLSKPLS